MNKIKKTISIILIVFIMLSLCSIIFIKINKISVFTLVSNSMYPTLKEGSVLFNKVEPFKKISTGDIITYKIKNSDIYVTHRVNEIDKENNRILCKGDANKDVDDSFIGYDQYKGTLKFYLPYLGWIISFFNSSLGTVVSISLLMILIVSIGHDIYSKRKM